jgi:hypothetical protein
MIRPLSRSDQGKHRSWVVYCGLALSVSLLLVQIQASPDALYAGKGVKPDAGAVSPAQENQETRQLGQLELGKQIEREIAGGQSHSYETALATGQYVKLVVEQRGIDVVIRLHAPPGELIAEVDSKGRTQGQETMEWVAEEAGIYRVGVGAKLKDSDDPILQGAPGGRGKE